MMQVLWIIIIMCPLCTLPVKAPFIIKMQFLLTVGAIYNSLYIFKARQAELVDLLLIEHLLRSPI